MPHCGLGKAVERGTVTVVGPPAAAVGCVCRCSGTPDLVGVPNPITGILQQQGIGRNRHVPNGTLKNRCPVTTPEMLT